MAHFCFVTGLYSRYDTLMFVRQGKSLVQVGFEVTYLVCDNGPDEVVDGIRILSTGFRPKTRFDRFIHSKSILKKHMFRINADIYQISDPELLSLVTDLKQRGKKVIFNMREYYPDMLRSKCYIPKLFRNLSARLYGQLMNRYLNQYDCVFTVTTWILDLLKKCHKVSSVHLLTNYPPLNTDFNLSYEQYCERGDVLCYVGTVYRISRQEKVFEALTDIARVRYLMAGRIEEGNEHIKQHPYWDCVEFIEGFARAELPSIFSRASISNTLRDFRGRDGSLGVIKIFESMEAALPVLFSDVPLYRKIVEKYRCGLCVDPNNSRQIADAINYLIHNKREAYEMGQRGRQAVIAEYNWQQQARNYISIINNL